MNTSGEAAEQIVRLSLEGVEVAAKITGSAAKEVAALLYAAFKNRDKNKTKGKQRLSAMLKSGKELSIFTVKNKDMKRFVSDAKRYGVVYCVLRKSKGDENGDFEVMVRAEDAAKINRIVDNLKIATVTDAEAIREDVQQGHGEDAPATEIDTPKKSADERLVDDMMEQPSKKTEVTHQNPQAAKTRKSPRSEPSSTSKSKSAVGTERADRPSVRQELTQIRQQQKRDEAAKRRDERSPKKPQSKRPPQHKQPNTRKKKPKSKER